MAKKKSEVVVYEEEDTLRSLLVEREALYEEIKQNGGEIPEEFDKNATAITQKVDDYAFVNELFQREIAAIKNEVAPFQKVVDIGKAKVKNLENQLKHFKEITGSIIEGAGEPGGADGKKRLIGHLFWIKSLAKEEKVMKDEANVPDEYMVAVVKIPYEDYLQFYKHLKLERLEYAEDLPDEFFVKTVKHNVQFFDNTQQEIKNAK